jgi:GNAT superfamily N-acetyltransferase
MAVAPGHQERGIGSKLLLVVDNTVAATTITQLWCNARTPAAPFYQKHGWQIVSEPFDIPTAGPHVKMLKMISPTSPTL